MLSLSIIAIFGFQAISIIATVWDQALSLSIIPMVWVQAISLYYSEG
jgi:hypothetical protein